MTPTATHPLTRFGGTAALIAALEHLAQDGVPARVVRVDRDRVAVTDGTQQLRTDPERSLITDPDTGVRTLPAIGDWVVIGRDEVPGILAVGERYGRLVRRDPGVAQPQILAVGIDLVIVTVPLDRPLNIPRLERELVTAFDADAKPVIALTKADVVAEVRPYADELGSVAQHIDIVPIKLSPGQPSHDQPSHDPEVSRLRDVIRVHGTGVLLGPSGAGKSTLTNALAEAQVRATGSVRAGDHKGRHVTATRALVALPGGGAVIDTPGLRALGLWDAEHGLQRAFREITETAAACKFLDCTHTSEPGCAVQAAVDLDRIDPGRLERYRTLYEELVETERERALADRNRRRRADRRPPQ